MLVDVVLLRRKVNEMACSEDLTTGYGDDILLVELYMNLPDALVADPDPLAILAAVLWLDDRYGLHRANDYVLVAPQFATWLMDEVKPTDPVLLCALADKDYATIERLTVEQPFMVKCESPLGCWETVTYPPIIRCKSVLLRVMNHREASRLKSLNTVRADGSFIDLPGSQPRQHGPRYRTVQELNA